MAGSPAIPYSGRVFWVPVVVAALAVVICNVAIALFCVSQMAEARRQARLAGPDPYGFEVQEVGPAPNPRVHCLAVAMEVNAVLAGAIGVFLVVCRMERRRRRTLGLPSGVSEGRLFSASGRGVVLRRGPATGFWPFGGPGRALLRLDPRGPALRPSRRKVLRGP
jgi:hypothetical protein